MTDINKSLINIGNNKLLEKAYDDILSNPGKKVGEALGTIINVGNTLLWPIKWANERTRIYFENNIIKYEKKLSEIPEDKIIEVPTEISMPILERFTYVSNEEISNAFINLLTSASSIDTIQYVHPSFIQIIDRISPDEAKIIKYISENDPIPHITLSKYNLSSIKEEGGLLEKEHKPKLNMESYHTIANKFNEIDKYTTLNFNENISLYIDNMISLGLIRDITEYIYIKLTDKFKELELNILEEYTNSFSEIPEDLLKKSQKIEKGMYELTDFGKLFIKTSIK